MIEADARERGKERLEEEERDAKCESELHEYHAQRKKRLHDLWSVFERREKAKLEKLKREIAKREKAKDTSNIGRPQCNSGSFEAKELGHEDVKKDILFEADSHRNNKRSRDRFKCEA